MTILKTCLRLTLVLFTVGGGFLGFTAVIEVLTGQQTDFRMFARLSIVLGAILFAFVVFSGLAFVHDIRRTRLMQIAFAIQIPYIVSPYFMYKFSAGAGYPVTLVWGSSNVANHSPAHFGWLPSIGMEWSIGGIQARSWKIGVNVVAIILLLLLRYAAKKWNDDELFDACGLGAWNAKTWVRLTIVLFTVGGGFAGVAAALVALREEAVRQDPNRFASAFVPMIAFSLVTLGGLLYVYNPKRTFLPRVSLGAQIIRVTGPYGVFKFLSGAGLYIFFAIGPLEGDISKHISWTADVGSELTIAHSDGPPVTIEVNLIALFLFLALRALRTKKDSAKSVTAQTTFWDSLPKPPAN